MLYSLHSLNKLKKKKKTQKEDDKNLDREFISRGKMDFCEANLMRNKQLKIILYRYSLGSYKSIFQIIKFEINGA